MAKLRAVCTASFLSSRNNHVLELFNVLHPCVVIICILNRKNGFVFFYQIIIRGFFMPPDQNTPQNPIPIENPSPVSPQEPTEPASENEAHSEPTEATQESQTAQGEVFEPKVINNPLPENGNIEPKEESSPQPSPEATAGTAEPETAQTPVNEALPAVWNRGREGLCPDSRRLRRFLLF